MHQTFRVSTCRCRLKQTAGNGDLDKKWRGSLSSSEGFLNAGWKRIYCQRKGNIIMNKNYHFKQISLFITSIKLSAFSSNVASKLISFSNSGIKVLVRWEEKSLKSYQICNTQRIRNISKWNKHIYLLHSSGRRMGRREIRQDWIPSPDAITTKKPSQTKSIKQKIPVERAGRNPYFQSNAIRHSSPVTS